MILSAGFGEGGPSGRQLQQRVLDAAQPHLLRLVGPSDTPASGSDVANVASHAGEPSAHRSWHRRRRPQAEHAEPRASAQRQGALS